MKPNVACSLERLPPEGRIQMETRFMVTVAHGAHMLAFCLPDNSAVRNVSRRITEITSVPSQLVYRTGDFERLGELAQPDGQAAVKLSAIVDLIWRASAFQRDPQIRIALRELVAGFTRERSLVV